MLQLDLRGFTARSYSVWLYKSNRREKGQTYLQYNEIVFVQCGLWSNISFGLVLNYFFDNCQRAISFVLPHSISAPERGNSNDNSFKLLNSGFRSTLKFDQGSFAFMSNISREERHCQKIGKLPREPNWNAIIIHWTWNLFSMQIIILVILVDINSSW